MRKKKFIKQGRDLVSLGVTNAGRHTSLIKYIILKSDYYHKNGSKAEAFSHVDGSETFVMQTASDLLKSHGNVLTREKEKKNTLDD